MSPETLVMTSGRDTPAGQRRPAVRCTAAAVLLLAGACVHGGPGPGRSGASYSARIVTLSAGSGRDDPAAPRAAVKVPARESYPAVLYLDGSGCRSVVHLLHHLDAVVQAGYAVVALEKRGVRTGDDGEVCSPEFAAHDTRQGRERLARAALGALDGALPGWNGKLLLVAASEATTFAPALARDLRAVRGLVLLGGGGWTQARELLAAQEERLRRAGATERERLLAEEELREKMRAVSRDPESPVPWLGHAPRRWASYLDYEPLPDLLAVEVPVYMANGVRDGMVPVASARAVVAAFAAAGKGNLTAREYPGLDHRWADADGKVHLPEVARDLSEWVGRALPSP